MNTARKSYPSDVLDAEWEFLLPYLSLMREDAPQRVHALRELFNAMRWRQIGPFRGGRVLAVTGVPGEPNVFYFGGASGGVWKTTDAGVTWQPLFDKQPIASIGAIAVANSSEPIGFVRSCQSKPRRGMPMPPSLR